VLLLLISKHVIKLTQKLKLKELLLKRVELQGHLKFLHKLLKLLDLMLRMLLPDTLLNLHLTDLLDCRQRKELLWRSLMPFEQQIIQQLKGQADSTLRNVRHYH